MRGCTSLLSKAYTELPNGEFFPATMMPFSGSPVPELINVHAAFAHVGAFARTYSDGRKLVRTLLASVTGGYSE